MATTQILINDFVGLPIIISDFDALSNNNKNNNASSQSPQSPSSTDHQSSSSSTVSHAYSTTGTASPMQQNWTTGFSDFADEMWAKMTQGMKQKLREACVEVLRKTEEADGPQAECMSSWQYDDDARFLD
ncbi:hypothetical protein MBLNU13_g00151t1 [Cladosporium sp. NU13]